MSPELISARLLDWYDASARKMPWRVGPIARLEGQKPDPYRVWLSEIMLQQTTVKAVIPYFNRFVERWPTVHELAAEQDSVVMAEWAGLGYYARARNLLKCGRFIVSEFDGVFPQSLESLLKLPGVGPYTAAAIASIAYDIPATVVDGNVERVMARYHAIQSPLPGSKPDLLTAASRHTPNIRPGDYAQAVMDLGATVCTPKSPACSLCPLSSSCEGLLLGIADQLPKKSPKPKKPVRKGVVFVARRDDGAWLLERRPESGLLGGMMGWPGTLWSEIPDQNPQAPFNAHWQSLDTVVRHTFTHFHLELSIRVATTSGANPRAGSFIPEKDFSRTDLPTVMRKVFDQARIHLGAP